MRQGITQCTDRQRMVDEIFFGESTVMSAYIPTDHPLYPADLPTWPYDVTAANALLDAAGYRDTNGDGVREDPTTGEPFAVRLTADNANPVRAQAAAIFQENLAQCGIAVTTEFLPPEDWYNDGPLGTLFGRRFELGMFAWLGNIHPACQLWLERNITGPELEGFGGWGNVNVSGWADADFEAACNAALNALPGTAVYTESHQAALRVWAEKLPIIPLFNYLKVAAVQPTVSGIQLDSTQPSELWNVFAWDKES
ncbi:MAG: ABC transporter substrate-binding protein [Chloroflexota bacterium]